MRKDSCPTAPGACRTWGVDSENRTALVDLQPTTPKSDRLLGQVLLVGAGPGDPQLLTLQAAKAIQSATLILVDDLVNEAVLAHASDHARIVRVGKRGGCKSTPQAFIEKLMVAAAQQGQTVVRLKGGDPSLFARAAEEMQTLRAQGIAVQIISGITAGVAAATAMQTSLTHRDHAHGVIFITGHAKQGDPGPDWKLLAHTAHQAKLSLVIYMGMRGIQDICTGLLAHLPRTTAAAVVQNASLPTQRILHTRLDHLARDVLQHQMQSPSVLLIGDVFAAQAAWQAPAAQAPKRRAKA